MNRQEYKDRVTIACCADREYYPDEIWEYAERMAAERDKHICVDPTQKSLTEKITDLDIEHRRLLVELTDRIDQLELLVGNLKRIIEQQGGWINIPIITPGPVTVGTVPQQPHEFSPVSPKFRPMGASDPNTKQL